MELVASTAPSAGHCNTMGTALSMNALAEGLGMSLPGCAAIPAPYRERSQMAYDTGRRAVELVREDMTPTSVMTRAAFENAIVLASALGASSNCPPHLIAIARHSGIDLSLDDWQSIGHDVPLLVNCQPAGKHLGEDFFRAGGVPAVMAELRDAGRLHMDVRTVTGRTLAEILQGAVSIDGDVIQPYERPLMQNAGFVVLGGSLFDAGIMKTSVISASFRHRHLSDPRQPNVFEGKAVVFEGPEDYHSGIDDPELAADAKSILIIRNCGPVGYPGSAEVVNRRPPAKLMAAGIDELPTIGDGRQSGTSASPSILNVSPEAAAGGAIALVETGDPIRVDLNERRVDLLVTREELDRRRAALQVRIPESRTPWQQIYRAYVGQLSTGACLELGTDYVDVITRKGPPRHSH